MPKTNAEKQKEYRERKKRDRIRKMLEDDLRNTDVQVSDEMIDNHLKMAEEQKKIAREEAKTKKEKRTGVNKRTRNWTFLVYPDSAPENWRDIINSDIIPWVESPLHKADNNPQVEGEEKPHWHVVILYSCVKTFEQLKNLTDRLNAPIPQMVENTRSIIRYLAHLDQPDKEQFRSTDIICHNGADISRHLMPLASAELALVEEMQEWINDNDCEEFFKLGEHARTVRYDDWYPLLVKSSSYLRAYIQSRRNWQKDCAIEAENRRREAEMLEWKRLQREQPTDGAVTP